VTFSYYASTSYALLYGVMTDPEDLNTFIVLDSIMGKAAITTISVNLEDFKDSIPASARYFAWRSAYNAGPTIYIDDVSILRMQCPLLKPSISDLESSKVRISSGLRTDNDWLLLITKKELEADSLNKPGYTYPDSIVVALDTVTSRSKLINGLEEKTTYYVAVASYCGDSIAPYWVTLNFTTPCLAVTPEAMGVIAFTSEEGYTTGAGGNMPCWITGNKMGGTGTRIPYVYGTAGNYYHNGNPSVEFYTGTTTDGAYAIMPQLNVDSIKDYQVNFWGTSWSTSQDKLIVGVVTDPTDLNTFSVIDTVSFAKTPNWTAVTVSFEKYQGDFLGNYGKYIMFLSEFGATNDVNITEISVEKIPSCKPVKAITADSIGDTFAYISFETEAPKARLLVAAKSVVDSLKATYDKWIADTTVTKFDSIRIDNLDPNTSYYAYVQNICSDTDSSKISLLEERFITDCPSEGGF